MIYNTLGNTMTISYPILIDGEASDLSQMDVSLYIECNQFSKEMDIEIEDNTITFTFEGKDQRVAGDYDIVVYINEGEDEQMILRNKEVFKLYR